MILRPVILALTVCMPSLMAQDRKDISRASGREEGQAWLICASVPEEVGNPVIIKAGREEIELILSNRSIGLPISIPRDGVLDVVEKIVPAPEDGSAPFKILTKVHVPSKAVKSLVILSPALDHPEGWLFHSKVVDLADFKGGSWLFMNASPLMVGVDLGSDKVELPAGEMKLYHNAIQSESSRMTIRYLPQEPAEADWKMLSASTVVIYPTRREICIFSWDPGHQRIDYHGITFPVEND